MLPFLLLSALIQLAPERSLTNVEYTRVVASQQDVRVATNGESFLAVWTDHRRGNAAVFASRFAADGTLIDGAGILIATEAGAVDVLWTGSHYLIAYRLASSAVVTVRMTAGGAVSSPPQMALQGSHQALVQGELATNGTSVFLATGSGRGALLDRDGRLQKEVPLAATGFTYFSASVASAGGEYLVAMATERNGVVTQRFDGEGNPLDVGAVRGSVSALKVAIATDGDRYLVAFVQRDHQLYAHAMTRDNKPFGELQFVTDFRSPGPLQLPLHAPRLVWNGRNYVLTFSQLTPGDSQHFALLLDAAGARIGAMPEPFSATAQLEPADLAALPNGDVAMTWIEPRRGASARILGRAGSTGTISLARAAKPQSQPVLQQLGGTVVTSWLEQGDDGKSLRVALFGHPPIEVARDVTAGGVTVNGDQLWVTWRRHERRFVQRFTASLQPIDARAVELELPEWANRVAFASGRALFTGTDLLTRELRGALVVPDGDRFTVTTFLIAEPQRKFAIHPGPVVWNGTEFVVSWLQAFDEPHWQFPEIVDNELRVVRITPDGTIVDAAPIPLFTRRGLGIMTLEAVRAPNGIVYAFQTRDWATHALLFTGAPTPPAKQIRERTPQEYLAVVRRGASGFVFGWRLDLSRKLALERITPALDATGEVATIEANAFALELLGDAPLLVYSRIADDPLYGGVQRLFVRHPELPPLRRRATR